MHINTKPANDFLYQCLISGDGQWVSERSLREYAADSVVQGVLASQLNRTANACQAQNQLPPLMPWPGRDSHSPQVLIRVILIV